MNESSTSVASLMDENKDLRYEIEQQLNIIESQKQELHSANRKLETLNKMKVEMEIEIEALTGLHQINGCLETKVKNLEAELSSTKIKVRTQEECFHLASQFTNLETELQTEKTNHEQAISELNIKMSNMKKDQDDESEVEKQKEEFQMKLLLLQETNTLLSTNNSELLSENKNLADKILVLELTANERNQEVEELKQLLEMKSNDLKSALKLVEELQEEKTVLNAELTTLKCHPVTAANNKRGNSLFSEVEDKRMSLATKLESFQNKYKELKKSYLKKNAELKALEAENIELRKQWKDDQDDPYKSMAAALESYKVRIQELTYTVSVLEKRPESPQLISVSEVTERHVDCIKGLIEAERKMNRDLLHEMEQRSIRELSLGEEIFELRREKRIWKAQTMKDAATIAELRIKVEPKE